MTTALLIIDVQRALCAGEYAAFDIARVIERINGLSARARSAGLPVVLVQHEEGDGPLQHDTAGWQLADDLATHDGDLRLRKTTPDAFFRTGLHALLQQKGVERVIVCGLQSEFCVDTTVRSALAQGYHVVLAEDAHSTCDNGVLSAAQISAHHNATLRYLTSFGPSVTLTPAADVAV